MQMRRSWRCWAKKINQAGAGAPLAPIILLKQAIVQPLHHGVPSLNCFTAFLQGIGSAAPGWEHTDIPFCLLIHRTQFSPPHRNNIAPGAS